MIVHFVVLHLFLRILVIPKYAVLNSLRILVTRESYRIFIFTHNNLFYVYIFERAAVTLQPLTYPLTWLGVLVRDTKLVEYNHGNYSGIANTATTTTALHLTACYLYGYMAT